MQGFHVLNFFVVVIWSLFMGRFDDALLLGTLVMGESSIHSFGFISLILLD
jgi:hypothetical protein